MLHCLVVLLELILRILIEVQQLVKFIIPVVELNFFLSFIQDLLQRQADSSRALVVRTAV